MTLSEIDYDLLIEDSKKFIDILDVNDLEVWTESGFIPIKRIGKTVEYQIHEITLDNNQVLQGADNHIVMTLLGEKFLKDLKIGKDVVYTKSGKSVIDDLKVLDDKVNMYDLELESNLKSYILKNKDEYIVLSNGSCQSKKVSDIINSDLIKVNDDYKQITSITKSGKSSELIIDICNHTYYTNNILSHNTLFLTHLTSDFIRENQNILYVTLEMSEFEINKRIDANLLKIPISDFLPENSDRIASKFQKMVKSAGSLGKLRTVEYPSSSCTVMTIRALLKQLDREESFKPDIIMIDQINTMADTEKNSSTYLKIKNIVEGLKAIATEYNLVVISATQANREAQKQKEDLNMSNVSESSATSQISDVMIGITPIKWKPEELKANPELQFQSRVLCNVMKNRLNGTNFPPFVLKQDFRYMELKD